MSKIKSFEGAPTYLDVVPPKAKCVYCNKIVKPYTHKCWGEANT